MRKIPVQRLVRIAEVSQLRFNTSICLFIATRASEDFYQKWDLSDILGCGYKSPLCEYNANLCSVDTNFRAACPTTCGDCKGRF